MTNVKIAYTLIAKLSSLGVKRICFCAGARNAPFIETLEQTRGLWLKSFFDERSAAFYALGLAKQSGEPVAVITTSGTAVAELLPAAIEAYYSGVPLVFLTADRPSSYRGSGSPQTIEQPGIFSHYTKASYDIEIPAESVDQADLNKVVDSIEISSTGATHINVCFSEPLIDGAIESLDVSQMAGSTNQKSAQTVKATDASRIEQFFSNVKRPLAIVGGIPTHFRGATLEFLLALGAPAYIEAPSGLRENSKLNPYKLRSGAVGLNVRSFVKYFDGILRIGSVPTLRLWRDLEMALKHVPVLSVHNLPFSGLSRDRDPAVSYDALFLFQKQKHSSHETPQHVFQEDQKFAGKLEKLLLRWRHSEASMVRQLSEVIPQSASVFLGNSLPIREWDLAASWTLSHVDIIANRGANGIDGLISTYLGASEAAKCEGWLILGDLSAMYDLNALAIADSQQKLRIVVINNRGGQIFSRMFSSSKFLNSHLFEFSHWAKMFGFEYLKCEGLVQPDEIMKLGQQAIIELVPDENESKEFWHDFTSESELK